MTEKRLDVLAIGAHPDDVELGCGGTLALLARRGKRVGIAHLTRGEAGTRGTVAERRREAERAAAALGAEELEFLDCGDGALRTGAAEEDALIDLLRRLRPELVLGPPPCDRHPDHGRACRLVEDACFYAGLASRGRGEPHRPAAVWSYMSHDSFEPDLVVDVGEVWESQGSSARCLREPAPPARCRSPRAGDQGGVARVPPGHRGAGAALRAAHRRRLRRAVLRAVCRWRCAIRWHLLPGGVR